MVFLLLVAETMPPTSDAVPLIGITVVITAAAFATVQAEQGHNNAGAAHSQKKLNSRK